MKDAKSLKLLVNEYVRQALDSDQLNEGMRMSETVKICGGNEVPFGSQEHITDLQRTLDGLEVIKSHWDRGTSTRYLIGSTCARVRKLIAKLMADSGQVA
jgi:hypothetical protein